MAKAIIIDGLTADEARERIYEIAERNRYRFRTDAWIESSGGRGWPEMDGADFAWIVETLLPRHSSYEIKRGPGVDLVIFGINSRYPSKRSARPPACMYARRIDGTVTDISWRECLKPANKRFKVRNAMRNAIRPQVAKWKAECLKECRLCGIVLDSRDFDADHYPVPFGRLVELWMTERGLTDETIETIGMEDFVRGDKFVNVEIEEDWFRFHAERAAYRQMCTQCHRKVGK